MLAAAALLGLLAGCGTAQGGAEVDLTAMSGTMVYSQVYSMVYSPEKYVGTRVKMAGNLSWFHDEATGKYYYACIIQDATACCAQGIEFLLAEEMPFSQYPAEGTEITVEGIFDTYEENGATYCTLRDAVMEVS